MTKKILFAAGDIGGARALIPVIRAAGLQGHKTSVLRHGHIAQEKDAKCEWLSCPVDFENATLDTFLDATDPDVMAFTSSVKDIAALSIARRAQIRGVKVLHVLDSWTAYLSRMTTDGKPAFSPDIYAVMDTLAAESANTEGISKATIRITGQPSLSNNIKSHLATRKKYPSRSKIKNVLFISEPVKRDQGASDESSSYRGYTEVEVLQLLCNALQPITDQVFLSLLPHPREDESKLIESWQSSRGVLQGNVLPKSSNVAPLRAFDGIIGMASILLYEGWIIGRPTLSLQPGLIKNSLRQIGARPGVLLVDSNEGAEVIIQDWIGKLEIESPTEIRAEAKEHAEATENVLSLILDLAAQRQNEGL